MQIDAILFDKDGTLFDFTASWSGWVRRLITELGQTQGASESALAGALRYDLATGHFDRASPVIAGTVQDCADLILPYLATMPRSQLLDYLLATASEAEMIPATPLAPLLDTLRAQGLTLGVATNDGEAPARAHLAHAGITDRFAQILGYDSGFTPKPAPDMLLGFAAHIGVAPARVVMVGDSLHDLIAGRAAGMQTIGVLTGPATGETLAPHADIILPHIGHLPDLLQAD
ncbi:MAG: HAD family hydrolase [Roseinatronobacter sp.]